MAETNVVEEKLDLTKVYEVIEKFKDSKGPLMPVLQEIQDYYGYISTKFIDIIADGLNVYPSQIFGVLTFYSMFYLNPRGKFI
ncbi:MAG: NAD(P)H-dependent oxidoreductase subunit E, partial [Candidatus Firestonebacteria bacterium]|nr:NAD(P)H-dependent oxidoreductase subunit E [Candidatus Firestonebacteria bacterium]